MTCWAPCSECPRGYIDPKTQACVFCGMVYGIPDPPPKPKKKT